jgi:hypothetical protein
MGSLLTGASSGVDIAAMAGTIQGSSSQLPLQAGHGAFNLNERSGINEPGKYHESITRKPVSQHVDLLVHQKSHRKRS